MVGVSAVTTGDMAKAVYDTDENSVIDEAAILIIGALATESQHIAKKVSNNLRHSHDAEVTDTVQSYTAANKFITFTNGIKGTLRIKFDIHKHATAGTTVNGRIYKNGVALGTDQSTTSTTYVTKSEDLDVGTIEAGETLALWLHRDTSGVVYAENFRVYYDDEVLLTAVAASNS